MLLIRNSATFWLVTLLFTMAACAKELSEPEVYLIPEGFVGEFHVVYDVKMGSQSEYEDGARLFRVNEAGVVHTSLSPNDGLRSPGMFRFFFVSNDGSREEITNFHRGRIDDSVENRNDKKIYMMSGVVGQFSMSFDATALDCEYYYISYFVGTFLDGLEGKGKVDIEDYYSKNGFPCNGELLRR